MKPNSSPWTIRQRCSADWEKMRGDDKRRFCGQCQKFVHNVSAMGPAERDTFADPANQHECVFYLQRADGQIADLSFLVRLMRWLPFFRLAGWSALVALLPVTLSGCMGVRRSQLSELPPIQANSIPASSQTTNQIGCAGLPQ